MPTIKQFEDIEAWKRSRKLTCDIYNCTKAAAFAKDFGLKDQIRRAAVSTMSNIAEGFERDGGKEFLQFLSTAKGSIGEVRAQLYVALDQRYITEEDFKRLSNEAQTISRMLAAFMNYLRTTPRRGLKYSDRSP